MTGQPRFGRGILESVLSYRAALARRGDHKLDFHKKIGGWGAREESRSCTGGTSALTDRKPTIAQARKAGLYLVHGVVTEVGVEPGLSSQLSH